MCDPDPRQIATEGKFPLSCRGRIDPDGLPAGGDAVTDGCYAAFEIRGRGGLLGHVHAFPASYRAQLPVPFQSGCENWRWTGTPWPDAFTLVRCVTERPPSHLPNVAYHDAPFAPVAVAIARGGTERQFTIRDDAGLTVGRLVVRRGGAPEGLSYAAPANVLRGHGFDAIDLYFHLDPNPPAIDVAWWTANCTRADKPRDAPASTHPRGEP